MNKDLRYKLDTAGIAAFVIGVLSIIGISYFVFGSGFYQYELYRNICVEFVIAFCASLFGLITGGLTGFLGIICASAVCTGKIAFGDAVAFGAFGMFLGRFADKYLVREGGFKLKGIVLWNLCHLAALIATFAFVKSFVDFIIYQRGINTALRLAFKMIIACSISGGVILSILFFIISKISRQIK